MATNKNFDIDDQLAFDDFDLDSMDTDIQENKVSKSRKIATTLFKDVSLGAAKGVRDRLKSEFVETSERFDQMADAYDKAKDAASEISDKWEPVWNSLKKTTLNFMPTVKNLMPKSWYDKIHDKLSESVEEEGETPEQRAARQQNEQIKSALDSIFTNQKTATETELAYKTAEKLSENRKFESQQMASRANIQGLKQIVTFLQGPTTGYMKKSLELQYQHLFIARDMYKATATIGNILNVKLEEIKHNTSLPDSIKINKGGFFKKMLVNPMKQGLGSLLGNMVDTAKTKILDQIKEASGLVGMFETASESASMIGPMSKLSALSSALGLGSKVLSNWGLGKWLGEKSEQVEDLDKVTAGWFDSLLRGIRSAGKRGQNFDANMLDKLAAWAMPEDTKQTSIENDDITKPTQAVAFDVSTRAAITKVIPRHLERIGDISEAAYTTQQKFVKNWAMQSKEGKAGIKLAAWMGTKIDDKHKEYNVFTGKLDTREEIDKMVNTHMLGTEEEQIQATDSVMSKLHTYAVTSTRHDEISDEAYSSTAFKKNIAVFLTNLATSRNSFDTDEIENLYREITQTNELPKYRSKWTEKAFRNISDGYTKMLIRWLYVSTHSYNDYRRESAISDIEKTIEGYAQDKDPIKIASFKAQVLGRGYGDMEETEVDARGGIKVSDKLTGKVRFTESGSSALQDDIVETERRENERILEAEKKINELAVSEQTKKIMLDHLHSPGIKSWIARSGNATISELIEKLGNIGKSAGETVRDKIQSAVSTYQNLGKDKEKFMELVEIKRIRASKPAKCIVKFSIYKYKQDKNGVATKEKEYEDEDRTIEVEEATAKEWTDLPTISDIKRAFKKTPFKHYEPYLTNEVYAELIKKQKGIALKESHEVITADTSKTDTAPITIFKPLVREEEKSEWEKQDEEAQRAIKINEKLGIQPSPKADKSPMTEEEVQSVRERLERIVRIFPKQQKLLISFQTAVEKANWKKAREISGKKLDDLEKEANDYLSSQQNSAFESSALTKLSDDQLKREQHLNVIRANIEAKDKKERSLAYQQLESAKNAADQMFKIPEHIGAIREWMLRNPQHVEAINKLEAQYTADNSIKGDPKTLAESEYIKNFAINYPKLVRAIISKIDGKKPTAISSVSPNDEAKRKRNKELESFDAAKIEEERDNLKQKLDEFQENTKKKKQLNKYEQEYYDSLKKSLEEKSKLLDEIQEHQKELDEMAEEQRQLLKNHQARMTRERKKQEKEAAEAEAREQEIRQREEEERDRETAERKKIWETEQDRLIAQRENAERAAKEQENSQKLIDEHNKRMSALEAEGEEAQKRRERVNELKKTVPTSEEPIAKKTTKKGQKSKAARISELASQYIEQGMDPFIAARKAEQEINNAETLNSRTGEILTLFRDKKSEKNTKPSTEQQLNTIINRIGGNAKNETIAKLLKNVISAVENVSIKGISISMNKPKELWGKMVDSGKSAFDYVKKKTENLTKSIHDNVTKATNATTEFVKSTSDKIHKAASSAFDTLKSKWDKISDSVGEKFQNIKDNSKTMIFGGTKKKKFNLKSAYKKYYDELVKEWQSKHKNDDISKHPRVLKRIENEARAKAEAEQAEYDKNPETEEVEGLKQKAEKAGHTIKDKAESAYNTVRDFIRPKYEKARDYVKDEYEKGSKFVKDKYEQGKTWLFGGEKKKDFDVESAYKKHYDALVAEWQAKNKKDDISKHPRVLKRIEKEARERAEADRAEYDKNPETEKIEGLIERTKTRAKTAWEDLRKKFTKKGIGAKISKVIKAVKVAKYVDIYLKDKVEAGKPLLSKKQQEEGVFFQNGDRVEHSYDIKEPVFDGDKQTLISEDNIKEGLVDVDNQPIGAGFLNKIADKISGFMKKGVVKSLLDTGKGIWDWFTGTMKTGAEKTTSFFKGLFGIDGSDFTEYHNNVIQRLDAILDTLKGATQEESPTIPSEPVTVPKPPPAPPSPMTSTPEDREQVVNQLNDIAAGNVDVSDQDKVNEMLAAYDNGYAMYSDEGEKIHLGKLLKGGAKLGWRGLSGGAQLGWKGLKAAGKGYWNFLTHVGRGYKAAFKLGWRGLKHLPWALKEGSILGGKAVKGSAIGAWKGAVGFGRGLRGGARLAGKGLRFIARMIQNQADKPLHSATGELLTEFNSQIGTNFKKISKEKQDEGLRTIQSTKDFIGRQMEGVNIKQLKRENQDLWQKAVKRFETEFNKHHGADKETRVMMDYVKEQVGQSKLQESLFLQMLDELKKQTATGEKQLAQDEKQTDLQEDQKKLQEEANKKITDADGDGLADGSIADQKATKERQDKARKEKLEEAEKKRKEAADKAKANGLTGAAGTAAAGGGLLSGIADKISERVGGVFNGIKDKLVGKLEKKFPGIKDWTSMDGIKGKILGTTGKVASKEAITAKFKELRAKGIPASEAMKQAKEQATADANKGLMDKGFDKLKDKWNQKSPELKKQVDKLKGKAKQAYYKNKRKLIKGAKKLAKNPHVKKALGSVTRMGDAAKTAILKTGAGKSIMASLSKAGPGVMAKMGPLLTNPYVLAGAAAAVAAGGVYGAVKGWKNAKKNWGLKEGQKATATQKASSMVAGAVTFGFGGKRATKAVNAAMNFAGVNNIIKAFGGNRAVMDAKDIEKFQKKCAVHIEKGEKQYERMLSRFNKAVAEEDWPMARAISGNEVSIAKELGKAFLKGISLSGAGLVYRAEIAVVRSLFRNRNKDAMTEKQIKAFTKKMQTRIQKGDRNAESVLNRFQKAVADENWVLARSLSGKQVDRMITTLAKKSFRLNFLNPTAMVVDAIFGNANRDKKPMNEKEIKAATERFAKLGQHSAKVRKAAARFQEAVENEDWKTARALSGNKLDPLWKRDFKILKSIGKWQRRIGTLGLSMLFEGESKNDPLDQKQIDTFTSRMEKKIKKGDKQAQRLLDAFSEAVAQQQWARARRIAKIKTKDSVAVKAVKNYWGYFMGRQGTPMKPAEIDKARESLERKIKIGGAQGKVAERQLDAFNDAVEEENWKKARMISKIRHQGIYEKIGVKSVKAIDYLFIGSRNSAMSEQEIKEARAKLQDDVTKGVKNAQQKLDMFEDAVADEKWLKARTIAKMKSTSAVKRVGTAIKSWWTGDNEEMSEMEINKVTSDLQKKIAKGGKEGDAAQKQLEIFERAVENKLWKKARAIAGIKGEGFLTRASTKVHSAVRFLTFGMFGYKKKGEYSIQDCDDIRKDLQEKVESSNNTQLWERVITMFDKYVSDGNYTAAYNYAKQALTAGKKELKRMSKDAAGGQSVEEELQLANRAKDIENNIKKSRQKINGWLHPIKYFRLGRLISRVQDMSMWSTEYFDDIELELQDIDEEAETTGDKDYSKLDPLQTQLVKFARILKQNLTTFRNENINTFPGLAKAASDLLVKLDVSPAEYTKDLLLGVQKEFDQLRQERKEEKDRLTNLQKIMKGMKKIAGDAAEIAKKIWKHATKIIGFVWKGVKVGWNVFAKTSKMVWTVGKKIVGTIFKLASTLVSPFKFAFKILTKTVGFLGGTLWKGIKKAGSVLGNVFVKLKDAVMYPIKKIGSVFASIGSKISNVLTAFSEFDIKHPIKSAKALINAFRGKSVPESDGGTMKSRTGELMLRTDFHDSASEDLSPRAMAEAIKNKPIEVAVAYDKQGRITDTATGDEGSVNIKGEPGGEIVHNHPDDSLITFSDKQAAESQGLKKVTVASPSRINTTTFNSSEGEENPGLLRRAWNWSKNHKMLIASGLLGGLGGLGMYGIGKLELAAARQGLKGAKWLGKKLWRGAKRAGSFIKNSDVVQNAVEKIKSGASKVKDYAKSGLINVVKFAIGQTGWQKKIRSKLWDGAKFLLKGGLVGAGVRALRKPVSNAFDKLKANISTAISNKKTALMNRVKQTPFAKILAKYITPKTKSTSPDRIQRPSCVTSADTDAIAEKLDTMISLLQGLMQVTANAGNGMIQNIESGTNKAIATAAAYSNTLLESSRPKPVDRQKPVEIDFSKYINQIPPVFS